MSGSNANIPLITALDVNSCSKFVTSVSIFYGSKVKAQWCK
jgi:hypothetical protein